MKVESGIPIPRKPGLNANRNLAFDAIDWSRLGIGDSYRIEANSFGGLRKRATAAGIEIEIRAIEFHDENHRRAKAFRGMEGEVSISLAYVETDFLCPGGHRK